MKIVYCHFSFRRPKDKNYGIFACALYADSAGKRLVTRSVVAQNLWCDHQHITAIQAYANALNKVYEWQDKLIEKEVTNVLFVTDNTNLAGWIANPKKNRDFRGYMERAYKPFHSGNKELRIGVGMCEPRKLEKSYKICKEELVENWSEFNNDKKKENKTRIEVSGLKSIADLLKEDTPDGVDSFKPKKLD